MEASNGRINDTLEAKSQSLLEKEVGVLLEEISNTTNSQQLDDLIKKYSDRVSIFPLE